MQTLKGREIYSQLRQVSKTEELKDKNDKPYFRIAWGKTVFTVDEDVKNDLNAGNIAEITLEEDTREVEVDGKKQTVKALAYAGHLTYEQLTNVVTNEGKITQLEDSFKAKIPTAAELIGAGA